MLVEVAAAVVPVGEQLLLGVQDPEPVDESPVTQLCDRGPFGLGDVGVADVTSGFDGTELVDPYEGDARLLSAMCGGVRVICVYVPNGRKVGTEYYERKLAWLECLHDWIAATYKPSDPIVMMGDFNVAPEDRDLWSPKAFVGDTHVTEPERAAVAKLRDWGFVDGFRVLYP